MSFIGLALASFAARRAYAAASVIAFFVFMPAVANIARVIITNPDKQRYAVLANPFVLITGFCNWLFDVQVNLRARNQFNIAATRDGGAGGGVAGAVLPLRDARDVRDCARVTHPPV